MVVKQKAQAISIIIPVYNEENYLGNCLDSIARQSVAPLEVIVVDNNSTDKSVEIANKYSFVKILNEARQHQSFAQKTGFAAAEGEIIGRIDADTILPGDWVAKVLVEFESDKKLVGLSGSALPYDVVLAQLNKFAFDKFIWLARSIAGHKLMWGANCAFRKKSYRYIYKNLSSQKRIWEDFDLSFCLSRIGKIKYSKSIDVGVSFRTVHKPITEILEYQYRAVRTIGLHKNLFVKSVFFVSWFVLFIAYPFVIFDRLVLQPIGKNANFVWGRKRRIDTINNSIR